MMKYDRFNRFSLSGAFDSPYQMLLGTSQKYVVFFLSWQKIIKFLTRCSTRYFPGFSSYLSWWKLACTKTQQVTKKASKHKGRIVFFAYQQVESTLSYHLSHFHFTTSQFSPTPIFIYSTTIVPPPPPPVWLVIHVSPDCRHLRYFIQYAMARLLLFSAATLQETDMETLFGADHHCPSGGGTP